MFFDNGFCIGDENKPLWSGYGRKKLPNPLNGTAPSFMKRPSKDGSYNREGRSKYFARLFNFNRAEKVNNDNNNPFVPFIEVNSNGK